MSYLLNEKRVKDVIIQAGWIAGIKSIFYSTEKIKKLETEKFLYLKDFKANNMLKIRNVETTQHSDGQHVVYTTISGTDPTLLSQQVRYFLFSSLNVSKSLI